VSRRLDSESLDPILGMIALCYWVFSPSEARFTVIPLVFALGRLTLLVKGVFLLRNSSEGLGLSEQELAKLPDPEQVPYSFGHFSSSVKILTIPGVTRHVFESFSEGQSFSRSAGLSADSHHLQPRKALLYSHLLPMWS
jgi:hypothetical protein